MMDKTSCVAGVRPLQQAPSKELPSRVQRNLRSDDRKRTAACNSTSSTTCNNSSSSHGNSGHQHNTNDTYMVAVSDMQRQSRPSVITCTPTIHKQAAAPETTSSRRITCAVTGFCDPIIEEHFRRSLGKNYPSCLSPPSSSPPKNSVCVTGTVDDHFAKALGDTWTKLQSSDMADRSGADNSRPHSRQPAALLTSSS